MVLLIWFLLWLTSCFAGYKLAKAQDTPESGIWLAIFLSLCFLTFIIAKIPGSI